MGASSLCVSQAMPHRITHFDQIPFAAPVSGAEHAAQLLAQAQARTGLSIADARTVVQYMVPRFIGANTTFIREGDTGDNDFLALLVEGDVVVERFTDNRREPATVRVLGPGALVGEIGLVDHEPRSASCTASTDIWCAVLTRDALERLLAEHPRVAAQMLLGVSAIIAERLRDTYRQLRLYVRLAGALRDEMDHDTVPLGLWKGR